MHPRSVQWVVTIASALFTLIGLASLFLRDALDGAIWLAIGALLAVFGTADQKAPLPRRRVILALALPR
jgi:hypothetical protein